MSLRSRIVLFTLGILLPALAAAAWMVASTFARERASVDAQLRDTTRALSLVVDRELERRAAIVKVLAASESLREWDLEGFDAQARAAIAGTAGQVALFDRERQFVNTVVPFGTPLPGTATGPMRDFNAGGPRVSEMFRGNFSGGWLLAMSQSVSLRGNDYNVVMSIVPGELIGLMEEQKLPESWAAAIVTRSGRVFARRPDPEKWIGASATPDILERMKHTPEGFAESVSLDGSRTIAFYSQSPRYGMAFILGIPRADLNRSMFRSVLEVSVGALLLIGIGIGVAILVSRRLVRPIEALQSAAADLEAGRSVVIPSTGLEEYDAVGRALVRASERIRAASSAMERRVAEAVAEAEAAQARLAQSQKLEVIGRLTGGIAHDFNNLLQTLSTGLHVLERMPQEARGRQVIEAGLRAVNRAARLVRQMLSFARRAPLQRQTLDFRSQLLAMEALLSKALPPTIRFQTDLAPDLWPVETDAAQLEVALLNLVFNARDASPAGGIITIRARNEPGSPDTVVIEIADDGTGIPPEIQAQVFEPFFTTKPVGQGTGLGLSQVRRFAEDSGGSVGLRSEPGQGTVVTLRLPRASGVPDVDEPAQHNPPLAAPCQLLFVEDDVLVGDVVTSALTGAGFGVVLARSGDEAIRRLEAGERFDIVFSDVVMPGSVDGVQLAERVAAEFPGLPVVLASGYSERQPTAPNAVLLAKPYSIDLLVRTLVETLERNR